jgi:hypothetical protein
LDIEKDITKPRVTVYDDSEWITGNNPGYYLSCTDCGYNKTI